MDPLIRRATARDVPMLLVHMREFYAHERIPFDESVLRAAITELLATPANGRLLIASDAGALVAYAVIGFGFSLEFHGRDAFIDELYVAPSHRGRGLGSRLLAEVEAVSREAGVHALHLEVDRSNDRAHELYRRMGFVDHDRHLLTKWLQRR